MNLLNVTQNFTTEDEALDYLISQRWPTGVSCVACGHREVYQIATRGKTGKPCRLFECAECKCHFSATTGTLFHDSHLPLRKWFMAMALMTEAKKGISANQVSRHLGIPYKTAWYLCHRIRKAMQEMNMKPLGNEGQVVEIDEMFLGGKRSFRQTSKEIKSRKVKVIGMVERGGRVALRHVSDLKLSTMKPVIDATVSQNAEKVVTDGSPTYAFIVPREKHEVHNHSEELRDFGEVTAKTIEGAFSLFKRGVVGSYHHLSTDHLDSYLQEFSWRYNRRKMQPFMFSTLMQELTKKKPLTYKKLTQEIF
jgi:transposase-like protein